MLYYDNAAFCYHHYHQEAKQTYKHMYINDTRTASHAACCCAHTMPAQVSNGWFS